MRSARLAANPDGILECVHWWDDFCVGGAGAGSVILLERASELAQVGVAVAAAAVGSPRVVLIEGPAGIGKTALLRGARQPAGCAGVRVLAARGGELARQLGFGVAPV